MMSAQTQPRQAATPTTPRVSAHASARHDERTSDESSSPEAEWFRGVTVHGAEWFFDCDEVRFDADDRVVLLRDGAEITTVLALDSISSDEREAVLGGVGRS